MQGNVWGHHLAVKWLDDVVHSLYYGKKLIAKHYKDS
jgi:hypothetical protein